MFVDSFYMFINGEVGHPGFQSDTVVSYHSWMIAEIHKVMEGWLGAGGLMIGNRGFAQDDCLMTPFPNSSTNREHLFNFTFSSRVEQEFCWWKNRWLL
jgi:hypothetical protein